MSETSRPALLGGTPAFSPPLAFTRPVTPPYEELEPEFRDILATGNLTKGPRLGRLEQALRGHLDASHVCAVGSCTGGLMLGIQALALQGEVIVPSFSFMASFHALHWNGLTPVFVDCEAWSLTVDPAAIEAAITPRTCAIMSAYMFGNPPDLDRIDGIARKHGLAHFCDSAHGIGTLIDGKPAGGRGDFEVFSCSPTKVLTAAEGGIVSTRRADVDAHVRSGRDYGNPGSYQCDFPGLNARMSEFHAALMLAGLPRLESYVEARQRVVAGYRRLLGSTPGIRFQKIAPNVRSSNKDCPMFIVQEEFGMSRDLLGKALAAEGIPTRAYFDPPGDQLHAYRDLPPVELPTTRQMCSQVICLPISSLMSDDEVERVAQAVLKIRRHASELTSPEELEARA